MTFPERDERAWNGRVAAEYGCTVTFENARGETLVRTRKGPPAEALRALCNEVTALDSSFRIVAYSTPQTILGDMTGARVDHDGSGGLRREQARPEHTGAARAGVAALVHERLRLSERPHDYVAREARERNW